MIVAVLDTNVFFQSLISTTQSSSTRVVERLFLGEFSAAMSQQTLDELINVLTLPRIQQQHGLSDDELMGFVDAIVAFSERFLVDDSVSPTLTRDVSDTKFLALADKSEAEFLVTNDKRHLLPLKRHGVTRIVSPGQFLMELDRRKTESST